VEAGTLRLRARCGELDNQIATSENAAIVTKGGRGRPSFEGRGNMRRQAIIAALLIVGVGVVLGATVFRADIAGATGLDKATLVIVKNTTTNPVPVNATDNPALQPFRRDLGFGTNSFQVPNGKRLVIQEVTGLLNADGGNFQSDSAIFRLTVATKRPQFFASDGSAHSTEAGTNTTEYYLTEQTTIYAEPGETVAAAFFLRNVGGAHIFGEMTVIGYLVNV
jgi:hypothetical protein